MATRSRRFRFTLRALLVSMALVSVLFAWLLHYRRQQLRERERIIAVLAGSDSYANFRYTLLGMEMPLQGKWAWLKIAAFPELTSVVLRAQAQNPLPEEVSEIARRAPQLEYEGPHPGKDVDLRRSTSAATKEIRLSNKHLSGDCLAFVGECPQLLGVNSGSTMLTAKSVQALLNHPRIEQLEMHVEGDDLSRVGELAGPSALRHLEPYLTFDWLSWSLMPKPSQEQKPGSQFPSPTYPEYTKPQPMPHPTGGFVWLRQCK